MTKRLTSTITLSRSIESSSPARKYDSTSLKPTMCAIALRMFEQAVRRLCATRWRSASGQKTWPIFGARNGAIGLQRNVFEDLPVAAADPLNRLAVDLREEPSEEPHLHRRNRSDAAAVAVVEAASRERAQRTVSVGSVDRRRALALRAPAAACGRRDTSRS